ncbi:hypothetical protein ACFLYF_01980 [Chloroflexota bacterium]
MRVLVQNIDKALALAGVLLGLGLAWLLREDYPELGIALTIAGIIYLLISSRLPKALSGFNESQASRRVYLLASIIFFPLFTYSIASVVLNPELYIRPLEYFIATSILVCLVAIEIINLPGSKGHTYFTLLKIVLIGISLQWLPQFMFPSLTGIDVFGHSQAVTDMLIQGHIPPEYSYAKLPIMPLSISTISLVTGLGYKLSGLFSTGLFYMMAAVFIFLIAERLFSTRIGLLSALMVVISEWFIHNGLYAIPNTLGIAMVLSLVYMLFLRREGITFTLLTIFMMIILVMTHTIAAFTLAIVLLAVWLGVELYHQATGQRSMIISLNLVTLFIVTMLAYWLFISGHIFNIGDAIQTAFGLDENMGAPGVVQYLSTVDRGELLLTRSGMLIFYFLAIVGILAILSRWFRNQVRLSFTLAAIAISIIAFAGGALGLSRFLPDRFLAYSQILLCIPVAVGLIFLSHTFKSRLWKYAVIVVVVLPLSFLMITSPTADKESPIYSQNTAHRTSYTQSEVQAAETMSRVYEGSVNTDSSYKSLLNTTTLIATGITTYLIEKDFTEVNNLVMIRRYSVEHVVFGGGGIIKLDYNPKELLEEQGFSQIYESGTVSAFLPLNKPVPEQ